MSPQRWTIGGEKIFKGEPKTGVKDGTLVPKGGSDPCPNVFFFLAVQNSLKGDLVPWLVRHHLQFESSQQYSVIPETCDPETFDQRTHDLTKKRQRQIHLERPEDTLPDKNIAM